MKQKWRLSLRTKPSTKASTFGEVVKMAMAGIEEEPKSKSLFRASL